MNAYRIPAVVLTLVFLTGPIVGQAPTPVGSEFRVDDYLVGYSARKPAMTLSTDGDFVLVWESNYSPGNDTDSAQGKKVTSDGVAVFNQLQLNTYTTGQDELPDVAPLPDGGFVVVWAANGSSGSDNYGRSVQFRRFDRDGNGLAPQFQVNSYILNEQEEPRVASAADGSFVIVWDSLGDYVDTSLRSVQAQRFDSAGLPAGNQFRINSLTTLNQSDPAVASLADGSFVVVWNSAVSSGTDVGTESIQVRRFASDGSAIGAEFQVNTYTSGRQEYPDIAMEPSGQFVVVWKSYGSPGSDSYENSIQGRRFASDGTAVGDQFQINTTTMDFQDHPQVGMADDGSFTVVWNNNSAYVTGQSFASDGSPAGTEFVINTPAINDNQTFPAIAVDGVGDFLATWDAGDGLAARHFRFTGDIGDRVWQDLNRDGLQDEGEPGLEGVTVDLLNDLSQVVASTVTDADGHYLFSQIEPGDYFLSFGKLDPFDRFTTLNAGDDTLDSDVDANGNTTISPSWPARPKPRWTPACCCAALAVGLGTTPTATASRTAASSARRV